MNLEVSTRGASLTAHVSVKGDFNMFISDLDENVNGFLTNSVDM